MIVGGGGERGRTRDGERRREGGSDNEVIE